MNLKEWLFDKNNIALSTSEYMYKTRHLLVIGTLIIVIAIIIFWLRHKTYKEKYRLFYVFCAIFILLEIVSRIIDLVGVSQYNFETVFKIIVPMHFCSVAVWVVIVSTLSKSKTMLKIATIFGLLATVVYLAYPAVGFNMKYITFGPFYSIFSHALGFVFSCCSLILLEHEFSYKKIWQPLLSFLIVIIYALILNNILFPGSNYMYISESAFGSMGLTLYRIIMLLILIVYINLFYIGSLIKTRIARKYKLN